MSPLATPTGSASVMATAMGGNASSTCPSAVSIVRMVVATPDGITTTGSPGRKTPLATVPAYPRKSTPVEPCDLMTYCTGNRGSMKFSSLAMYTVSR